MAIRHSIIFIFVDFIFRFVEILQNYIPSGNQTWLGHPQTRRRLSSLGTSSKYYWENNLQHTTFDDTGGYSHKMEVITVMGQDPGAQPTIIGFLMANGCLFPQS